MDPSQEEQLQSPDSAATTSTATSLMFLPKDQWSKRFDSNFYTVKIDKYKLFHVHPDGAETGMPIEGRSSFPAHYFEISVYRGHETKRVWRRYSQFKWLYGILVNEKPISEVIETSKPLSFPPGSCPFFQDHSESFLQNRMNELEEFLTDALSRPGYASHPAVIRFLSLSL